MNQKEKNKLFESIKTSFDAETQADLVKYFRFLTGEIERLLEACEDKKSALIILEKFKRGDLEETEEVKKMLPTKAKVDEAVKKLKTELAEYEKEFDIVETLMTTALAEVKSRIVRS